MAVLAIGVVDRCDRQKLAICRAYGSSSVFISEEKPVYCLFRQLINAYNSQWHLNLEIWWFWWSQTNDRWTKPIILSLVHVHGIKIWQKSQSIIYILSREGVFKPPEHPLATPLIIWDTKSYIWDYLSRRVTVIPSTTPQWKLNILCIMIGIPYYSVTVTLTGQSWFSTELFLFLTQVPTNIAAEYIHTVVTTIIKSASRILHTERKNKFSS